jgi:hypothetical protein
MEESVFLKLFQVISSDPSSAVMEAKNFSSDTSWIRLQASEAAVGGATAAVIPVFHLPVLAADIAFLMNRMSYCCWGIGSIYGCTVEGKADFAIILAHWAGAISDDKLNSSTWDGKCIMPLVVGCKLNPQQQRVSDFVASFKRRGRFCHHYFVVRYRLLPLLISNANLYDILPRRNF